MNVYLFIYLFIYSLYMYMGTSNGALAKYGTAVRPICGVKQIFQMRITRIDLIIISYILLFISLLPDCRYYGFQLRRRRMWDERWDFVDRPSEISASIIIAIFLIEK